MEDKYPSALEALRAAVADLDEANTDVSARAADLFLTQEDNLIDTSGVVDRRLMAKALFLATAVLLSIRDNSADDVHHLIDTEDSGVVCEDDNCLFDHELELDTSYLGGQIDGMDAMIAAMTGMSLAVADSEPVDFDQMDWSDTP